MQDLRQRYEDVKRACYKAGLLVLEKDDTFEEFLDGCLQDDVKPAEMLDTIEEFLKDAPR